MSATYSGIIPLAAQVRQRIVAGSSLDIAIKDVCVLDPESKPALQAVSYGAIRHFFLCEQLIGLLASRKPNPRIHHILAVALSLLIDSQDKSYALVNETVSAIKSSRTTAPAAGFVNACLRRFCRERETLLEQARNDRTVRFNAPAWWIDRLEKIFGKQTAEEILQLQTKHPPLTVRINRRKLSVQDWIALAHAQGLIAVPVGVDGAVLAEPTPITSLCGFSQGLVSVQDAGAQLAAQILSPHPGARILDACAAPGGKTAHMAEISDANITALEIDPLRFERIRDNMDRLGLSCTIIRADANDTALWWDGQPFDEILLDAPCTASGIVRRHPDIPLLRAPLDIPNLASQQKRLLESLWPLLKRGGKLLYAVCSIFPEEGPEQIEKFLHHHPDAHLIPFEGAPTGMLSLHPEELDQSGSSIGHPFVHDGFFYALICKA